MKQPYVLRPPSLCETFQRAAGETWNLLGLGAQYEMLPGEETLTDLLLLGVRHEQAHIVRVHRFSKSEESSAGADWEMWFTDTTNRYIGVRVQAKKLDPRRLLYPEFETRAKRNAACAQA